MGSDGFDAVEARHDHGGGEGKNVSRSGLVGVGQDDSGLVGRSLARKRKEASAGKRQRRPCWEREPVGRSYSLFQILNFSILRLHAAGLSYAVPINIRTVRSAIFPSGAKIFEDFSLST